MALPNDVCLRCYKRKEACRCVGVLEQVDPLEMTVSPFAYQVHNFELNQSTGDCNVCKCPKEYVNHPHVYRESTVTSGQCVCTKTRRALIHQMTQI